ncbi:MAG: YedE family putative selenium transporter [Dehalococcoidales bacterium]|nr:YedE family putative selenium transporter [Dehalococcoidales bacterium]
MSSSVKGFMIRWGAIITGIVVGILAPVLVKLGNPGNMGMCVVCFTRDTAGALAMHRAAVVQYIRPEIVGLVLGALIAALAFREFKPRTGSSPFVRFILGVFASFGGLVFLGCPWRAYLRLGGGDLNAIFGILGLVVGIVIGIVFLRSGFSLGRNRPAPKAMGWVMPVVMIAMLVLLLAAPQFGRDADGNAIGPIFFSTSGPGSQHAPIFIALGIGLLIGFLAQRSRFCTVGAFRDAILMRDNYLLKGVIALIVAAVITNLALGQFNPGFADQPIAHTNSLWNFGGMVLAGLAFTLAGGCPGRQFFLTGEGDGDAAVFVTGMLTGAGFAHNFGIASSASGPGLYGPAIVIIGIAVCVIIGLTMRDTKLLGGA